VNWDDDGERPGTRENRMPMPDGAYGKLSMDSWQKAKSILTDEGKRLYDVAFNVTPLEVVQSAVSKFYNNVTAFQEKKNYRQLIYNFFCFETSLYFWKYHPKSNANDETLKYLLNEYDKFLLLFAKEWKQGAAASGTAQEMPQSHNMGAQLETTALNLAKKEFGGGREIVKVVFTSSGWTEAKEANYPYRVQGRSIPTAVIAKDGDKYLIRYFTFVQQSDMKGGWTQNYGFQVPMGGSANWQPVNYK